MKTIRLLAFAGALIGMESGALAQAPDYLSEGRNASRAARTHRRSDGVSANNRCNGMSYGTGARSCGTASGGPVGGIGGRN